MALWATGEEQD